MDTPSTEQVVCPCCHATVTTVIVDKAICYTSHFIQGSDIECQTSNQRLVDTPGLVKSLSDLERQGFFTR